MQSLQSITDAWGKWIAKKKGTSCKFTASTNYSTHSELDDYHKYQCTTTTLSIVYDGDSPPTNASTVSYELWYNNTTDLRQTENFQYTSTTEQDFDWSVTAALNLGVKISATVGVPDEASTTTQGTIGLDLSGTLGGATKNTQTWSVDTPIQVPQQSALKCDMVVNSQSYNVLFTQSVMIKNDVAIWFDDKVDFYSGQGEHWLWFVPIEQVFDDVISNQLADTDGYKVVSGGVQSTAQGLFTGGQGVSVGVTTTQYPAGTTNASQAEPIATDKIYNATMANPETVAEPA